MRANGRCEVLLILPRKQDFAHFAAQRLPRPLFARPGAPGGPHRSGHLRVIENPNNCGRDSGCTTAINHRSSDAITHRFRGPATAPRNDGDTACRGFEIHNAQALDVQPGSSCTCGHGKNISALVQTYHHVGVNAPGKSHRIFDSASRGEFFQLLTIRSSPGDDEVG